MCVLDSLEELDDLGCLDELVGWVDFFFFFGTQLDI